MASIIASSTVTKTDSEHVRQFTGEAGKFLLSYRQDNNGLLNSEHLEPFFPDFALVALRFDAL